MKRKIWVDKIWLLTIIIIPFFNSCAQTKSLVNNVYAYYIERTPGTIAVDENGRPLKANPNTIIYTFYTDTKYDQVKWDTAIIQHHLYRIVPNLIKEGEVEAGIVKATMEPRIISAEKGSYLWKLDLLPMENIAGDTLRSSRPGIILIAKYQNRRIEATTNTLIELYTPPAY